MVLSKTHHRTAPRRVDFSAAADLEAMVLAANGWGSKVIQRETGLTPGQVQYRCTKSKIRITDYRTIRTGTLGGQVAKIAMKQQLDKFTTMVERRIQRDLPTKRSGLRIGRMTSTAATAA